MCVFRTGSLILQILLTASTLAASGQKIIEGQVRSKEDDFVLPGVNVIEIGTDRRTNTDGAGRFLIRCSTAKPTLEFSFIGLRTVQVNADGEYLTVHLETDEKVLKEKIRLGIHPEYTAVGLNGGINFTPAGFALRNSLPTLFSLRMLTTATLIYRTDFGENDFLDIRLVRDKVLNKSHLDRYVNVQLGYNRRRIHEDGDAWKNEELNIIPELVFDSFLFRLGYGRQSFNDIETLGTNEGIIFGMGKYFQPFFSVSCTAKKWNGYWQSEFQFTKGFRRNDFEFGVRFETLDEYRELDLLVLYRIHY